MALSGRPTPAVMFTRRNSLRHNARPFCKSALCRFDVGDEATRKSATELRAAGLLPKPIDFDLLRPEIDQRLEGAT